MPDEVQEELTAYLDGELDPAGSRRVEERLKNDPAYREELQRLEQAWNMLDELDRVVVGEAFTRTTMEIVAVAAADDARRAPASLAQAVDSGGCGLWFTAACLLGFACGANGSGPIRIATAARNAAAGEHRSVRPGRFDRVRSASWSGPACSTSRRRAGDRGRCFAETSPRRRDHDRRAEIERMTPLERAALAHNQDHFATILAGRSAADAAIVGGIGPRSARGGAAAA